MANVTHSNIDTRRVGAALNGCVEACIDGQKTYAIAAASVRDAVLKQMLQHHSDQRAAFVVQLQHAMRKLGVAPENEGTFRGAARQRWMETRHALEPRRDNRSVLRQCVRDQEDAMRRYTDALRLVAAGALPVDVRVLLDEQLGSISLTLDETRRHLDAH
jgi:uncharacterized protein (TIGR02284 family)